MSGIIKRHRVAFAPAPRIPGASPLANVPPGGDSRVELLHEGDDTTSIRVTCGCGRVTTIDCDYDEPHEPQRPTEGDR